MIYLHVSGFGIYKINITSEITSFFYGEGKEEITTYLITN